MTIEQEQLKIQVKKQDFNTFKKLHSLTNEEVFEVIKELVDNPKKQNISIELID